MKAAQILALAKPKSNSIRSQVNPQTNNNNLEFANALRGALNQSTDSVKVNVNTSDVKEGKQTKVDSNDSQQLLEGFEELFAMIPLNEGFFDPELLKDPNVIALLNQLQQPMQQVLNLIQKGLSFEDVLAQTETGSKEQLTLLLLASLQLEKSGQYPEQMKQIDLIKMLQRQINEVFKVQIQDQPANASELFSKLVQTAEKKSVNSQNTPDSGQSLTQFKTELRQIIQKVLYSGNAKNSGQSTGQGEGNKGFDINPTFQVIDGQESGNESLFDQIVTSSIKEGGSLNKIQQYILNVQHPTGSSLPEDQILTQLKSIMKLSKFSTATNGTNQLLIKLHPEHLGSLTIKLSESNGEMMARIIASSSQAKEVIESNLQALRHVFITQNINVEKFEIGYQGDQQFAEAKKEKDGQQNGGNGKQQSPKEQESNSDKESQHNSFSEELLNLIV